MDTKGGLRAQTRAMSLAFIRDADWLGRDRARGYLWVLAALNVATLGWLVATSHGGVDRNGFLLGTDFLSFWTAGHMLVEHANVYDLEAHVAAQRGFFAPVQGFTAFFYPPVFLPFCYPLGWFGYFPALAAWLLTTGGLFLLAARAWMRTLAISFGAFLVFVAFPPALIAVTHGQTSFLVAALLGGGLLLVRDRPALAGVLLGLATIKPQLGILVPVALIATGQTRAIAAAVGTALALAAVTTLAFGTEVWGDWLALSNVAGGAMDAGRVGYAKMVSPLAAMLLLGAPVALAYSVQAVFSLAVAGAVAWIGWKRGWSLRLGALVLAGTPLATPFVLDYDLVILAFPLLVLASGPFRAWEKAALACAFVAPAFARPLAMAIGVPVMVPAMLGLFAVLALRSERAQGAPAVSGTGAGNG